MDMLIKAVVVQGIALRSDEMELLSYSNAIAIVIGIHYH